MQLNDCVFNSGIKIQNRNGLWNFILCSLQGRKSDLILDFDIGQRSNWQVLERLILGGNNIYMMKCKD